jgi:hypothetical protein
MENNTMDLSISIDTSSCQKALDVTQEIETSKLNEYRIRELFNQVLETEGYEQMLRHHSWSIEDFVAPLVQCVLGWQPSHTILEKNPWGIKACAFRLWQGLVNEKPRLSQSISFYTSKGEAIAQREGLAVGAFWGMNESINVRIFVVPGGHSNVYATGLMDSDVLVINPLLFKDENFVSGTCCHELCHIVAATFEHRWKPKTSLDRFLVALLDEGQASYISKVLLGKYQPCDKSHFNALLTKMNSDLLVLLQLPHDDENDTIQRAWFSGGGTAYTIGQEMCHTIDCIAGRLALVSNVRDGVPAFLKAFNQSASKSLLAPVLDQVVQHVCR